MRQIELPPTYCLDRVRNDYPDFRWALAREFIQNSVDAGATRIDVTFQPQADDSCLVAVVDDGKGCDRATIETKLLVFGASGKDAVDGAVGGFGLAKELLYLAWPRWQIETRGVIVRGAACTYEIADGGQLAADAPGFRALINIPATERPNSGNFRHAFRDFVGSCRLRGLNGGGVVVTLDGAEQPQSNPLPGRALRDLGWCKLYREPNERDNELRVRACGVTMFAQWSGHEASLGRFTVELTGRSVELLTSGRNAFRSSTHRRELADFIATLRTDSRRATRERAPEDVVLFLDDGAATQAALCDGVRQELAAVLPLEVAPAPVGDATQAVQFAQCGGRAATTEGQKARVRVPDYGVPHFALHTRGPVGKVQKFLETPRAAVLARGWAAAVHAVLAAAGTPVDATGFTFVADVEAECVQTGHRTALLVNPTKVLRAFTSEELIDLAIHEAAHLTCSGHTEDWAIQEMQIRRALRPTFKAARAAVEAGLRGAEGA